MRLAVLEVGNLVAVERTVVEMEAALLVVVERNYTACFAGVRWRWHGLFVSLVIGCAAFLVRSCAFAPLICSAYYSCLLYCRCCDNYPGDSFGSSAGSVL